MAIIHSAAATNAIGTAIGTGVLAQQGSSLTASRVTADIYRQPEQMDMFGYPECRITVHKARNGHIVRIAFDDGGIADTWLVQDGQTVPDIIAAAIAERVLRKESTPHGY